MLVYALPGNPVSALVTCALLVAPVVRRLAGAPRAECFLPRVEATLSQRHVLDPLRPEYHRAVLRWEQQGERARLVATSAGVQRSSRLLSMGGATNALLLLPSADGVAALPAGTAVTALLLAPCPQLAHASHADAMAVAAAAVAARARAAPSARRGVTIRVCVLTVSDRASAGEYEDLSGPALSRAVLSAGAALSGSGGRFTIGASRCVPDDAAAIASAVRRFCADEHADIVLTTGGTGFGARDTTPEALTPLITRPAPGVVWELMRCAREHTPLAALSRPVAGVHVGADGWTTFVATLPGSPRAVVQAVGALAPLLAPLVDVMRKAM